jgi:hypothetical protein
MIKFIQKKVRAFLFGNENPIFDYLPKMITEEVQSKVVDRIVSEIGIDDIKRIIEKVEKEPQSLRYTTLAELIYLGHTTLNHSGNEKVKYSKFNQITKN